MKKKLIILICWLVCVLIFAAPFGLLYKIFIPQKGESLFLISESASNFITGLFPAYIFFLPLLFTAFGGVKKYWWLGILLLPAVGIEIYFDFSHIYFPIILGVAGWAIGFGIAKLLQLKSALK